MSSNKEERSQRLADADRQRLAELESRLEDLEQWRRDWAAQWAPPPHQPRPAAVGPRVPIVMTQAGKTATGEICNTDGCSNPASGLDPRDSRPICMQCLKESAE